MHKRMFPHTPHTSFWCLGQSRKLKSEDEAQHIMLRSSFMFGYDIYHLILGWHPPPCICHHLASMPLHGYHYSSFFGLVDCFANYVQVTVANNSSSLSSPVIFGCCLATSEQTVVVTIKINCEMSFNSTVQCFSKEHDKEINISGVFIYLNIKSIW